MTEDKKVLFVELLHRDKKLGLCYGECIVVPVEFKVWSARIISD